MPNYFTYRLIPPRPSFATDMDEGEMAIMGEHGAYWDDLFQRGQVVVFGPVMDGTGSWGLAVVETDAVEDVHAIAAGDPAVKTQLCTVEIGVMLEPLVRSSG